VTHERGGRPRGPERVPFTTTLVPGARDELTRRARETYGTERAANRVIEEAMGFAAARKTASVPTTIYVERNGEEVEVKTVVEFELSERNAADDWMISEAKDERGEHIELDAKECDKACDQALEKFCADKDAYL
jgi:hypothetical protein